MPPSTTISGNFTLYALPAYGGWTAHAHDDKQHTWTHNWSHYFPTREEAQENAVTLGETMGAPPRSNIFWS